MPAEKRPQASARKPAHDIRLPSCRPSRCGTAWCPRGLHPFACIASRRPPTGQGGSQPLAHNCPKRQPDDRRGRRGQTPMLWLGCRAGTGGDGLTLSGDPLRPRRPIVRSCGNVRIGPNGSLQLSDLAHHGGFTLSSAGLLVGLVVVERQPKPSVSDPRRSSHGAALAKASERTAKTLAWVTRLLLRIYCGMRAQGKRTGRPAGTYRRPTLASRALVWGPSKASRICWSHRRAVGIHVSEAIPIAYCKALLPAPFRAFSLILASTSRAI